MPISGQIKQAVGIALRRRVPFVVFMMPGEENARFFAAPYGFDKPRSDLRFIVSAWCAPETEAVSIMDYAGVSEIISDSFLDYEQEDVNGLEVWHDSTDKAQYIKAVEDVIDDLNNTGGKTVVSKTIAGQGTGVDWTEVAERYFAVHPEAFRYMYFTHRHGCWLGASPEILLSVQGDEFTTMALAGTRLAGDDVLPWNGKDVAEQAIVRDYIVDRLYDLGLHPHCSHTDTVRTGNLEHLCTVITGNTEGCPCGEILKSLNPTPALAGYPLHQAFSKIIEAERHPRRCYGGYVAVERNDRLDAYVNLRCVNFDDSRWCMYVGGGIMPESDAENEWSETEAKAEVLRNIILSSRL